MDNENVHFGALIEALVRKNSNDIDTEAARWGYLRNNLYKIFKKKDVNTEVLKKACKLYRIDMSYFLAGDMYHVKQTGKLNVFGESHNSYNQALSKNTQQVTDGELLLARMEIEGLRNQIETQKSLIESQKEMIEILKNR